MKDVIYAGFAQLCYLDWHNLKDDFIKNKLNGEKKLSRILGNVGAFNQIKTQAYENLMEREDYCYRIENNKRIYSEYDARLFYLYSENEEGEPEKNPKYPEFGQWEFLCAYDHNKIYNEISKTSNAKFSISSNNSGFQASAFRYGDEVMIAYRGSEILELWEDFVKTSLTSLMGQNTEALTCAVWFYEKVLQMTRNTYIVSPNYKKDLPQPNYHITGHSMGGALAQYVAVYSEGKHKTVTWNSLGLGSIARFNLLKRDHSDIFRKNIDLFNKRNPNGDKRRSNIKNYYLSQDFTASLKEGIGIKICVDSIPRQKEDNNIKELFSEARGCLTSILKEWPTLNIKIRKISLYHFLDRFIPFFHQGNIVQEKVNLNYLESAIKTVILKDKKIEETVVKNRKLEKKDIDFEIKNVESDKKLLFPNILKKTLNEFTGSLYKEEGSELFVGKFNNLDLVANASGGLPYKIKLSRQISKASSFEEALEIILPTLKVEKKYYAKADIASLNKHIEALDLDENKLKNHPLNYSNAPKNEGYAKMIIDTGEYKQNFYTKEINRFRLIKRGKEEGDIHLGCDFSYGRANLICCTHPPVYSPVAGVVVEATKGKVVIENKEIEKIIQGEKVQVPYHHIVEHLFEISVTKGQIVKEGQEIGNMGGRDTSGKDENRYLEHVHYSIAMNNKYYTGNINIDGEKDTLEAPDYLRYIDPEKFWDKGSEEGVGINSVLIKGGLYTG